MTINFGRVVLGGIVAGIVIDGFETVINGMILAPQWAEIMKSLNRPEFAPSAAILFNIVGLITGVAAIWTYAAIKPRFGAGPSTALIAAALIWLTVKALGISYQIISGIYPIETMAIMLAAQIPEIVLATLAGAWVYREEY